MPTTAGSRIVVDGLWRCLCPSVDTAHLLRAVRAPLLAGRGPAAHLNNHRPRVRRHQHTTVALCSREGCSAASPVRLFHSASEAEQPAPWSGLMDLSASHASSFDNRTSGGGGNESSSNTGGSAGISEDEINRWVGILSRAQNPYRKELQAAPTAAIYAVLRYLQDSANSFDRIHTYVRYLLEERHEPPSTTIFEALLRANCDPRGSANAVRDVLNALRDTKVEGTTSLYHGALAVLAVHPDYMLRFAVLQAMKERWMDLTPDGQQSVAIGLLRDGQYERALDHLESMAVSTGTVATDGSDGGGSTGNGGIDDHNDIISSTRTSSASSTPNAIPPWLFDMYIYVLGQEGFVADALKIINHRLLKENDTISLNVWAFLLDVCCRQSYHHGLWFVWRRVVRTKGSKRTSAGLLSPSDAQGLDILGIAARHRDIRLATEAMQILSARGTKLSMVHFEAMVECYANAGVVHKALQALCIMSNAGIIPDEGSTRAIFLRLTRPKRMKSYYNNSKRQRPTTSQPQNQNQNQDWQEKQARQQEQEQESPEETSSASSSPASEQNTELSDAVDSLFKLRQAYGSVPIAAFNVVLESLLAMQSSDAKIATVALDLYRHVRSLCPAGPDRATFRALIRKVQDVQHLNFLASEMEAFQFRLDTDTINLLVHKNAREGSLDQALRHLQRLSGMKPLGDGDNSFGDNIPPAPAAPPTPTSPDATSAEETALSTSTFFPSAEDIDETARAKAARTLPWINMKTATALVRRCLEEEDPRLWQIVSMAQARGRSMDTIIRQVRDEMRQKKKGNAYGIPHSIDLEQGLPSDANL